MMKVRSHRKKIFKVLYLTQVEREIHFTMAFDASNYVLYLEEWKVAICLHDKCGYGISPKGIAAHLRVHHRDCYDLQLRRRIESFVNQLDLMAPSKIKPPMNIPPPIPGLKIIDGWQCRECNGVGMKTSGAIKHCRKEHGWSSSKGGALQ